MSSPPVKSGFGWPTQHQRDFAEALAGYAEGEKRAVLAALRRGLGKEPGLAPEMYPYIVRWVPDDARWGDAYYLVASLFGWAWKLGNWEGDPAWPERSNLGASFARLAAAERTRLGAEPDNVERRFVALLNANRDDLPEHLRHAVGLLRAREVMIDWAKLLHDLQGWDSPRRTVQRAWARAYWGTTGTGNGVDAAGTAPAGETGDDHSADDPS